MKLLSTKEYEINHQKGKFSIYISKNDNDTYYGGILYYNKSGEWSDTVNIVSLKFEFEQFVGIDEQKILDDCKNWIDKNLNTNYTISFKQEKIF